MRSITFVRHAMPEVEERIPSARWRLSDDGRDEARAHRLSSGPVLLASDEPKAIETVAIMAGRAADEVTSDPGFGEVRREESVDEGFRERRRAWIRGDLDERHAGWEAAEDAAARFDAALMRCSGDLVVGTHGMILTAWFVRAGIVAPGEAAAVFWESLSLPDVITIKR